MYVSDFHFKWHAICSAPEAIGLIHGSSRPIPPEAHRYPLVGLRPDTDCWRERAPLQTFSEFPVIDFD